MINKETKVAVYNKFNGMVGYNIPDMNLHRDFAPNQTKEISFEELDQLMYAPGGKTILTDYLEIKNEEVIKALFDKEPEPEYHYTRKDIQELMISGTLDQFLDCLDFAPESVKEVIKDMAVELPLNDVSKRKAILEKLGFDVNRAIQIKNTKYDGSEENQAIAADKTNNRRAAPIKSAATPTATGRRYQPTTKK